MMVASRNGDTESYNTFWPLASQGAHATGRHHALMVDLQRAMHGTPITGDLIDHYEQLLVDVQNMGSTMLLCLVHSYYGTGLYMAGATERGLELIGMSVDESHGSGAAIAAQPWPAAVYMIAGQVDTAAPLIKRGIGIARRAGLTQSLVGNVALAVLIAAQDGHVDEAAALAAAAEQVRHNLGIRGDLITHTCLEQAEALIANSGNDTSATRARGAQMTIEDIVNASISILDWHIAAHLPLK
jgi:hypothetical protein